MQKSRLYFGLVLLLFGSRSCVFFFFFLFSLFSTLEMRGRMLHGCSFRLSTCLSFDDTVCFSLPPVRFGVYALHLPSPFIPSSFLTRCHHSTRAIGNSASSPEKFTFCSATCWFVSAKRKLSKTPKKRGKKRSPRRHWHVPAILPIRHGTFATCS